MGDSITSVNSLRKMIVEECDYDLSTECLESLREIIENMTKKVIVESICHHAGIRAKKRKTYEQ